MNPILKLYLETGALNHAYLLTGELEVSRRFATEIAGNLLQTIATETLAHPDFFYQKVEILGIKDSQEIKRKASTRPFLGDKKVFIIETLALTIEAENALLKTIEEPPIGTHFFVLVPTAEVIIPTLRSRFSVFETPQDKKAELKNEELIKKIISATPPKRLDLIKAFFEKDKAEVIEFLNELGFALESQKKFKALEEVEKVKKFLFNPTGSQKMILEHLALTLPQL